MKENKTLLVFICSILASCSLSESKRKGIEDLERIEKNVFQTSVTAFSTPRITLGHQISELQSLQKELASIEVSDCLQTAKESLNLEIDTTTYALTFFMNGNKEEAIKLLEANKTMREVVRSNKESCQ